MVPRRAEIEPSSAAQPGRNTEATSPDVAREQVEEADQPGASPKSPSDDDEESIVHVREVIEDAVKGGGDESLEEIGFKSRRSMMEHLGRQILNDERTSGDLAARSKQAVLHLTLTEARISELEVKLRLLEADIRNLPDDFELHKKKIQCPVFKPVIRRCLADEFRITEHSRIMPADQKPAIEILVSENFQDPIRGVGASSSGASDEPKRITRRPTGSLGLEGPSGSAQWVPERVRIRSWALVGHLERVCRENLSTHRTFDVEFAESAPLMLLRPFKLLFHYEQVIRDSYEDVQQRAKESAEKEAKGEVVKGSFNDIEFRWQDLQRDLKLLIDLLDVDLKPTFDLREAIRNGTATDIDYNDLWHLFNLGDTVVAKAKREQAFRVVNFAGGRDPLVHLMENEKDRVPPVHGFAVDCCSVEFNGVEYVPNLHKFCIRRYLGTRPIDSLEVYPLRLDPKGEKLREVLLTQGRHYLELTRQPFYHRMHRGRTLDEPPQDLEGQVIVDIAMALNAEPEWLPSSGINPDDLTPNDLRETQLPPWCGHSLFSEGCCGSDYVFKDLEMASYLSHPFLRDYGGLSGSRSEDELKDDVILLPNWVRGFILRLRKWATFKMDDLTEVPFDNDFNELMIAPSHKQTILALVETHEKSRTDASTTQSIGTSLDLVKGKGTGLILLLHGEPGVGKTSTAECVADKTKRPLFPITCGDIGETAMEVESKLQQNFRLAHRWDSVLLLDEADVFLAKRNKTDLRRNAVTSVFLRSLDYYAGILFLTTNRVGGIDPAFKSRIHLSVYYPRLGLDTTMKLFEAFLRRAKDEQARVGGVTTFKFKDKEILRFAKRHYRQMKKEGFNTWNGRQIRNAFQTAIALIEYEAAYLPPGEPKPVLGKAHFEAVAEGSKQFDVYLMRTLQGGDDEIAMRDQWRDDHFELDVSVAPPLTTRNGGRRSASRTTAPSTGARRDQQQQQNYTDSIGSDTESESESESESDSDGDEADGHGIRGKVAGRDVSAPTTKGKDGKGKKNEARPSATEADTELDEYEQYLKFKAMMKSKGKA